MTTHHSSDNNMKSKNCIYPQSNATISETVTQVISNEYLSNLCPSSLESLFKHSKPSDFNDYKIHPIKFANCLDNFVCIINLWVYKLKLPKDTWFSTLTNHPFPIIHKVISAISTIISKAHYPGVNYTLYKAILDTLPRTSIHAFFENFTLYSTLLRNLEPYRLEVPESWKKNMTYQDIVKENFDNPCQLICRLMFEPSFFLEGHSSYAHHTHELVFSILKDRLPDM